MSRVGLFRITFCLFLSASASLYAVEFGVSVSGGVGFWDGVWNTSVKTFSEDIGQSVSPSVFPVGSLYVDAALRPAGPLIVSAAVGAGAWGGRMTSSGGASPDRVSSVVGIGLDLVPSVGLRFPSGKAEFGADIRVGLGILVSPLWNIDAWPTMTSAAAYIVPAADLGYAYAGASLIYGVPLGGLFLNLFVSGDIGLAAFDASSGTKTPITLSRACLGVRLSSDPSKTGRRGR